MKGLAAFRHSVREASRRAEVHPFTTHLLDKLNYDTSRFRSKGWEEFSGVDAPPLDFGFTVCDNAASEVCPVWPGQLGVPDPTAIDDTETVQHAAFFDTYRMLFNRISLFTYLPFENLDKISLQNRLGKIGKNLGWATIHQKSEPSA